MQLKEKNKITYLHFIMSVLVILIHSINNETKFERFFSIDNGIGQFAVPLFFIISGFLFFRNVYTVRDSMMKLQRRIETLLMPFIWWNIIYYCIHLLIKPGSAMNLGLMLDAAFNYTYNPAFWFMYQLILLCVISPILVFIESKNKFFRVVIFIVLSMLIIFSIDIPYLNEDAMIYYYAGMLLSRFYNENKIKFISRRNFLITLALSILIYMFNRLMLRAAFVDGRFMGAFIFSIVMVRLIFAFVIFYFIDIIFSYKNIYKFMGNTFFLYAIHYAIVKAMIIVMKYFMYKFIPSNISIFNIDVYTLIECIIFIISPIVCVIINYYLSAFLIKKIPKVYNALTGNRR